MFSMKQTKTFKSSKDASVAASKIKQKVLNTSSFFKVSLKITNRALARALQAQKERVGQLEREVVNLHKQMVELNFELAARKYKHRRLLQTVKRLQSHTLECLSEASELLTDLESPDQCEDQGSRPADVHGDIRGQSLRDPLIRVSSRTSAADQSDETCGLHVIAAATAAASDASGHTAHRAHHDEEKESARRSKTPPPTSSHLSLSLRAEEGHLPAEVPRSDPAKSVLEPQDPPSADRPAPPPPAEPRPPPNSTPERTMLLNTLMEMTMCNTTEIVTVESKAKKKGQSRKTKSKLVREDGCTDAEGQDVPNLTVKPTQEKVRKATVPEPPPPDTWCKKLGPSRIPKLDPCEDRFKPPNRPEPSKATPSNLDDFFSDPNVNCFDFVGSATEEKFSKVTCRKSRTKSRKTSSVTRKTIVLSPADHAESRQSGLSSQQAEGEEGRLESRETQRSSPETSLRAVTHSRGSHKIRCRSTFVVSVERDGNSPDRDATPPAGPDSDGTSGPNQCATSRSSWKRPWTANQELCGGDGLNAPSAEHDNTTGVDTQMHKKARKLSETFVISKRRSVRAADNWCPADEAVSGWTGNLLMDELPPWFGMDISSRDTCDFSSAASRSKMEGDQTTADLSHSSSVLVETGGRGVEGTVPSGRVLAALTSNLTSPDGDSSGRPKRQRNHVSYKEPSVNRKMRCEGLSLSSSTQKKTKKIKRTKSNGTKEAQIED